MKAVDRRKQNCEHEELQKWHRLRGELKAGAEADEAQFCVLNVDAIIREARIRAKKPGNLDAGVNM